MSVRAALLLGVMGLTLASCASGRTAEELRATVIGRMPPPPGSALASEYYEPASWNVTGPICATLQRTYASNDADAFLAALAAVIRAQEHDARIPDRFISDDHRPGYRAELAATLWEDAVIVQLDFHDVDEPSYTPPDWLDRQAWRYVIHIRLSDTTMHDAGGGCDQSP